MENLRAESLIQENVVEPTDEPLHELSNLQLAFVGGGIGETAL